MEKLYENAVYVVGGAIGVITTAAVAVKLLNRPKVYNDPRDTVILCSFPRGPLAPNQSPFSMKLELFLKVANIPHKVVDDRGMSPKNKTPWMMYNGEVISDSQFCIDFLKKKFNVDLDKDLSAEQRAVSRALRRMVEDGFYWNLLCEKWVYSDFVFLKASFRAMGLGPFMTWFEAKRLPKMLKAQAIAQGTGNHTKEKVREMGWQDLKALSDYLGQKTYFMGDKFTELDCSIFGFLCQLKFHGDGTIYEKAVTRDFPNLDAYIERVKTTHWKDWDDCVPGFGAFNPYK